MLTIHIYGANDQFEFFVLFFGSNINLKDGSYYRTCARSCEAS